MLKKLLATFSRKKAKPQKRKIAIKKVVPKKVRALKPIGKVTHFFTGIKVAIIKFKKPISVGATIRLEGATTNFVMKIGSMQYDHKPMRRAKKNQQMGIKVPKRVREGDLVYEA